MRDFSEDDARKLVIAIREALPKNHQIEVFGTLSILSVNDMDNYLNIVIEGSPPFLGVRIKLPGQPMIDLVGHPEDPRLD